MGNFQFKDVTEKAGLDTKKVWTTGVSMADVNGDGWMDIFITKSGNPSGENRRNELLVNKGTDLDINTACSLEIPYFSASFSTEDQKEGMNEFLGKKKPVFKGK